jgi:fumarylpyruvate hydrolase
MHMPFVFDPPAQPSLGVAGSDHRFPIRRVFCVGRNYAAHAREMGNDPSREPPFFFMKPADAVVSMHMPIPFPPETESLHHEVEMVVALQSGGRNLSQEGALAAIWGYGVGLDLTRRDVQDVAKQMSRPWDMAKGFDASAPCSDLVPVQRTGHPSQGRIWLEVNGQSRQTGDLAEMIWKTPEIISYLSNTIALKAGDLIFTGTPSGVGPLKSADHLRGGVEGVASFECMML